MKSLCELDSRTAYNDLAYRLVHLFQNSEPVVVVPDHVTNSLLHMEGRIVDRKQIISIDRETFVLKTVKISINVDS
jgi:hypothetical protein